MEKKKTDVKMIAGTIIMVVVLVLIGGSFWNVVATQAEKDRQEEERIEASAIYAIYLETGEILKQPVFVDMENKTIFTATIPTEGIYNKKGKLISDDVLEVGDEVKIYGDNIMTLSIPAQYPGVTKMQRIGRASLEETEEYLKLVDESM